MADHKTLAEALVAFQSGMPKVHKGKSATVKTKSGDQYRYTYADLADVQAVAVPLLVSHGLSFTSKPRRTEQGDYELVGMLRHTSGEADEGCLPIHGRTPQEVGSSLTYGRRYLLGCLTGIVTDDDDDAQTGNTPERTRRDATPAERQAKALGAAKARVKAAWEAKGWTWDASMAAAEFNAYTNGDDLTAADVAALDAFTDYLTSKGGDDA